MSINMPIIRIETPQTGIKPPVISRGLKNNPDLHSKPLPFGIKIKDNSHTHNFIKWLGDDFDSAMQRFVSGATALVTQPFFDLNNKNVDEDTRKTSCARTIGKIIAGITTGVTIREICIQLSKNFTKNEDVVKHEIEKFNEKAKAKGKTPKKEPKEFNFKKWQQCLLPDRYKNADFRKIKKYRNAFGTTIALVIMFITNFLIDAPLTTYLTNFFVKKFKEDDKKKEQKLAQGGKL